MSKKRRVSARAILVRAREILSKRGAWTQGTLAENRVGAPCEVAAPEAKKFCAYGALDRAFFDLTEHKSYYADQSDEAGIAQHQLVAVNDAAERLGTAVIKLTGDEYADIADYNDNEKTKKAHILKALDLAIGSRR